MKENELIEENFRLLEGDGQPVNFSELRSFCRSREHIEPELVEKWLALQVIKGVFVTTYIGASCYIVRK